MENEKDWRNKCKQTRGHRKGQFMKRPVTAKRKVQATKRLCEDNSEKNIADFTGGREIVEINVLAKEMWCLNCKIPLSFEFATQRTQRGLASIYDIKCSKCFKVRTVHTNTYFGDELHLFSINAKAAMGLIDAGIGESQFNSLLSTMNIAPVPATLLKRYERIIGAEVESVAMECCSRSLENEKSLSKSVNDVVKDETGQGKDGLTFSFDVGWQKRGTGRAYNSLSGHGVLIGHYSKEIVSYAIRSKNCRKCSLGHPKTDHNCRLNYEGSAKSMEADMAVELFTKNSLFEKHKVFGARLIMDNDSSTIAGLRKVSIHSIELWADKNHSVKAFANSLYGMSLPKALVDYFTKNLSNVIAESKGQPEILQSRLRAIVPHAFGDHDLCTFHEEKENYVFQRLPNKKPLESKELRTSLQDLMTRYINNVDKLAPAASTQGNESFNNTVASFCPKSKHFSASESLNFRVAAAVCQKNVGQEYVNEVFKKINLSPLQKGLRYRKIKQEKMKKRKLFANSREGKKRRNFLKSKRSSKASNVQRREGITYETDVGLSGVLDIPIDKPMLMTKPISAISNFKIVYTDTETTGLTERDEICQIAAYDGESFYNVHIVPTVPVKPAAFAKTGLSVKKGELFHHGNKLQTVSREQAILNFIDYLENLKNHHTDERKNESCSIILVGHNVIRFDAKRIEKLAEQFGLRDRLTQVVYGYSDTLSILKKKLPERLKNKLSFSEEALVKEYLPEENVTTLHDALEDIKVLKKLVEVVGLSDNDLKNECQSISQLRQIKINKVILAKDIASLHIFKDVVTTRIINKMAKQGINKEILIDAYKSNPTDGIKVLLSMSINKKARVTSSPHVIKAICDKIKDVCK